MNKKEFTLVTGAAGFIGSQLTNKLVSLGRNVIAVDCFLPDLYSAEIKQKRWNKLEGTNDVELKKFIVDLRHDDLDFLRHFKISSIFNQAAMPGLSSDWSRSEIYYECNLLSLNRLLEFSRTLDIRSFVQASTSSVYGKVAVGDENLMVKPISPYGVSKLAAEQLLLAYLENFGLPSKILRYFSVYGPGQRPDMAYARIISALKLNKNFIIFGDGNQKRSNTYISDIVKATVLAETGAPSGSILNVCGDECFSLNDAIEMLEQISGKTLQREFKDSRTGDQAHTEGINEKAKSLLKWSQEVYLEEGLRRQFEGAQY